MGKIRAIVAGVAAAGMVAFGIASLAGPARAGLTDATWTANGDSSIVNPYAVQLQGKATSVETPNLGVEVQDNTTVTFEFSLEAGAQCIGGAPRVFVVVSAVTTNSWDQLQPDGQQCGVDGKVTFKIKDGGTIAAAGVVYDNDQPGFVIVKNLKIDDKLVAFQQPATEPPATPTATPTEQPTTSPTGQPDESEPAADPSATASPSGATLPVTGEKGNQTPLMVLAGLLFVAGGIGVVVLFRNRDRTKFTP